MIFLIEYDRPTGKLLTFRPFQDSDRSSAQAAKLELELDLHRRGVEREVVFLEAQSEELLRKYYRRYFEDLPTLLQKTKEEFQSRLAS